MARLSSSSPSRMRFLWKGEAQQDLKSVGSREQRGRNGNPSRVGSPVGLQGYRAHPASLRGIQSTSNAVNAVAGGSLAMRTSWFLVQALPKGQWHSHNWPRLAAARIAGPGASRVLLPPPNLPSVAPVPLASSLRFALGPPHSLAACGLTCLTASGPPLRPFGPPTSQSGRWGLGRELAVEQPWTWGAAAHLCSIT